MAPQDILPGDTFKVAREGRQAIFTIMDILPGNQFFQLHLSDGPDSGPRRYVTLERLQEIIGTAEPISRDFEAIAHDLEVIDEEDLAAFDNEVLIPAETVSAHVTMKEDGAIEVRYYAWSDVWDVPMDVEPRALRNEVTGLMVFESLTDHLPAAVAAQIARELYPYRISPDTHVSAHLFPAKRGLLDGLRLKLFGGPSFIPNDDLTARLEAEMRAVADASPASEVTILLGQAA